MKTYQKKVFIPVHIILDTREEVINLRSALLEASALVQEGSRRDLVNQLVHYLHNDVTIGWES